MLKDEIVEHLKQGAILITPTRRLGECVINAYNDILASHNGVSWQAAHIECFQDWCALFWQEQGVLDQTADHVISPIEATLIMEDIIKRSAFATKLLKPHSTAKLILQAWQILHAWRKTDWLLQTEDNADAKALQTLCAAYQKELSNRQLIDGAQLLDRIIAICQADPARLNNRYTPNTLIYFGYDDITPQFQLFLDCLSAVNWCIIKEQPIAVSASQINRLACHDSQQECLHAAQWAKKLVEEALQANHAIPKIGIVLPNLPAEREVITKTFDNVFDAYFATSPQTRVNTNFNISTAVPLIQYPIVGICFALFRLVKRKVSCQDVLDIFASPFIAHSQNHFTAFQTLRASFLQHFSDTTNLKNIKKWLLSLNDYHSVTLIWLDKIDAMLGIQNNLPLQNISAWCDVFETILECFDWPGERVLNSIEYQAVNRFYHLLDEYRQSHCLFGALSFDDALDKLQKQAANVAFQPENKQAHIQILGMLEASGIPFDYLWIMNLHHEHWPPKAEPNPFLPLAMQRHYNMPHASAAREYEFAKQLTDKLLTQASHIICSYPMTLDNQAVGPSELIQQIERFHEEDHMTSVLNAYQGEESCDLIEWVDDFEPIALPKEQVKQTLKGGSQILQFQAQCPFKAFAKTRLNANTPQDMTLTISPLLRGIMMHEILQLIWGQLKTTAACRGLGDKTKEFIQAHVDYIIKKYQPQYPFPQVFWEIERSCLFSLIEKSFVYERARADFVVEAVEAFQPLTIGALSIHIRIDRVDRLENSDKMVIDYKTGKVALNDITSLPLKAPQLPIYYKALQQLPTVVCWMQLHNESVRYVGISAQDTGIAGIEPIDTLKNTPSWQQLTEQWDIELNRLADDYVAGQLCVMPVAGNQTCRLCDLQGLCRVEDKKRVEKANGF